MEDDRYLSQVAGSIACTFRPQNAIDLAKAHEELETLLPRDDRFMASLLLIAVEGRGLEKGVFDLEVRKAASIVLRKEIESSWKSFLNKQKSQSEKAKSMVRDNILEGLIKCGSIEIATFLGHSVSSIISRDYPQHWATYEDTIKTILSEKTPEKLFIGFLCLHCLGRVRKYFIGPDRSTVEKTTEKFLPIIVKQAKSLSDDLGRYPNVDDGILSVTHILLKNINDVILVRCALLRWICQAALSLRM